MDLVAFSDFRSSFANVLPQKKKGALQMDELEARDPKSYKYKMAKPNRSGLDMVEGLLVMDW